MQQVSMLNLNQAMTVIIVTMATKAGKPVSACLLLKPYGAVFHLLYELYQMVEGKKKKKTQTQPGCSGAVGKLR